MSKKAEAEVPSMYPLKGEHRCPEKAKEGIIDLTRTDKQTSRKRQEKRVKKRKK